MCAIVTVWEIREQLKVPLILINTYWKINGFLNYWGLNEKVH